MLPNVDGAQFRLANAAGDAGADRFTLADCVTPLRDAPIVAVWPEVIVPAVILNEPLLAPLAMPTLAATARVALPPESVTVIAPMAALFRATVQVALWPLLNDPGVHDRDVRTAGIGAGAVSDRFVVTVPPFKPALIMTFSSAGTPVTLAVNCALLCPAPTVTDPGTLTFALLSERATTDPKTLAAERVTVQVAVPALLNVFGEQPNELKAAGAGATRFTDAVRVTPLRLAVTIAV